MRPYRPRTQAGRIVKLQQIVATLLAFSGAAIFGHGVAVASGWVPAPPADLLAILWTPPEEYAATAIAVGLLDVFAGCFYLGILRFWTWWHHG